jgi:hypothetical protein
VPIADAYGSRRWAHGLGADRAEEQAVEATVFTGAGDQAPALASSSTWAALPSRTVLARPIVAVCAFAASWAGFQSVGVVDQPAAAHP